jgi:hypothetical protein
VVMVAEAAVAVAVDVADGGFVGGLGVDLAAVSVVLLWL